MTYFPVDDQAAFHPKFVMAGNAAIGVWTRAGSYCKQHTTGGFVPADIARALGTKTEIDALVRVGLWIVVDGGYQFHDWGQHAGNGTAEEEKARREAEREAARVRAQRARANKKASNGDSHAVNHGARHGVTHGVTSHDVTPEVRVTPVPVPLTTDTQVRHVPDREVSVTDDSMPSESVQRRALAGLGITGLDKIKLAIGKHTGRAVDDQLAVTIIADLLEKGGDGVRNAQAYVLRSIEQSWPEVQKLVDEVIAA